MSQWIEAVLSLIRKGISIGYSARARIQLTVYPTPDFGHNRIFRMVRADNLLVVLRLTKEIRPIFGKLENFIHWQDRIPE